MRLGGGRGEGGGGGGESESESEQSQCDIKLHNATPELLKEDEKQVESEDGQEDPVAAVEETETFTIFHIQPKSWQRLNR